MLPAHGPVGDSFHDRARELLDHHARRLEACLDVHVCGATALEVATRLRWTRRDRGFAELDAFNRMLAVCETVAHLDLLVDRGLLLIEEKAGTRRYVRPS
jgi:hypothetical protein